LSPKIEALGAGTQRNVHAYPDGGTQVMLRGAGQQSPLALTAASETEFFATAANLRVQFERAAEGTVVCMTLSQGDSTIRLTPEVGYGPAESDQSSARAWTAMTGTARTRSIIDAKAETVCDQRLRFRPPPGPLLADFVAEIPMPTARDG
jgi:hypothetical protein